MCFLKIVLKHPCLFRINSLNNVQVRVLYILEYKSPGSIIISRVGKKLQDFKGPALIFKDLPGLDLFSQIQGLSRIFKTRGRPENRSQLYDQRPQYTPGLISDEKYKRTYLFFVFSCFECQQTSMDIFPPQPIRNSRTVS